MKRAALMLALTLFASLVTTARADAQILSQLLSPGLTVPVVNTGPGAVFNGTFTLRRFVAAGDTVAAVGTLTGVLTPAGGTPTAIIRNLIVPTTVTQAIGIAAACPILHLDLGPLFLDVLGLQVDLSQVVLDVGAEPGPGNLLGNLLCAVTGLLDSPGGLARLLNQILGILG